MRRKARRPGPSAAAALVLTFAAGAGTLATTSVPAVAQGSPGPAVTAMPAFVGSLARIKAEAANQVSVRARSLTKEITEVQSYSFLGSDQATMVSAMQSDITGLQALDAKIQSDTTLQQAKADAATIFTAFRVYYLVLPVMSDVANADHVDNVLLADLSTDVSTLQADENSSNQGAIGPLVAGMQQESQAASSATSGLSAQLLAYTPADWNSNHGLLDPARASIATADRAVGAAERDYYQAVRYLDRHPTAPPGTTTSTQPGQLAAIQAKASRAISERVGSLNTAIALVQSKSYLGGDQATLVSDLQTDDSALQTLDAKISADTTVAEALSDYDSIFSQLRVYLLVMPVVNDVIRVDYVNNVVLPTDNQEISTLQGRVNPSNQGVLTPLIADMQDQVQVATGATSGLSAQLLTFTPAEWNSNHQLFASTSANIATANQAVATAAKDYSRALAYIRGRLGPKPPHKPVAHGGPHSGSGPHGRGR